MNAVFTLIGFLLGLFLLCLVVRLVFDWVQFFARDWRPRGVMLVIAEAVYTVTDPPLRALRRVIPPLTLGQVRLDLAFLILFIGTSILQQVFLGLGR
ncbi:MULTISPECIES: YggT family protein [unclassified Isoptericola]|uniref:YggT family protein n=1 Tax=Isoptericola sp. NPDC057191 TaxID=3346041 RepID=UPI003626997C